jgi:hypothetical protein
MLESEGGATGDGAPSIKRRHCNVPPFKISPPTNQPTIRAQRARASAPVLALCRELLAAGLDPDAATEAYRAGTMALRVRSIGEGALLARGAP